MKSTAQNIGLSEYYFDFLKNLSAETKIDLIERLSKSLKNREKEESVSLQSLFGAYKSSDTAEEIMAQIRSH